MARLDEPLQAALDDPATRALLADPSCLVHVGLRLGRILWVGPNARRLLGHDPDDLVGRNGFDLIPTEDVGPIMRLGLRHPRGDLDLWVRVQRGDERLQWCHVRLHRRHGLVVTAMRPEPDPSKHHVHGAPVGAPA